MTQLRANASRTHIVQPLPLMKEGLEAAAVHGARTHALQGLRSRARVQQNDIHKHIKLRVPETAPQLQNIWGIWGGRGVARNRWCSRTRARFLLSTETPTHRARACAGAGRDSSAHPQQC